MSYPLNVVGDRPLGLWMMDDSTPFQDHSGRNYAAAISAGFAANATAAPVVSSAPNSAVLDRFSQAEFTTPVYQRGSEDKPFALESWLYPIQRTSGYTAQTYRENWASNPRFETSTSYSGQVNAATIARVTTERVVGSASLQVTTPGVGAAEGMQYSHTTITQPKLLGAQGYLSSTILAKGSGTISFWIRINYTDSTVSTDVQVPVVLTANWQEIKVNKAIDSTKTISIVQVFARTATTQATTFYIGGLTIENTQTASGYFDGTAPGYEWVGAEGSNATISRTRTDIAAVNQIDNPFATLTNGRWLGTSATISRTTADFYEGNSSLLVTATATTAFNVYPNGGGTLAMRVFPGQRMYHKVAIKRGTRTGPLSIIFYWYRLDGSVSSNPIVQSILSAPANWTVYSNSAVAPADAAFGLGIVQSASVAPVIGETIMIDSSYYGSQDVAPFDGASPGAVWNGTAYSSYSIMYRSDGPQQILGNNGLYDGLSINGTKIKFSVAFNSTGSASAEYDIQVPRRVHAVGYYTGTSVQLFIDGELVAEEELTDAQKDDLFVTTNGKLYSGLSLNSQGFAVNSLATYASLSPDVIKNHYLAGRDYVEKDVVAAGYNGEIIGLAAKKFLDITLDDDSYYDGTATNVMTSGGVLVPLFVDDVSVAGNWQYNLALHSELTSIYGMALDWDGIGATVETSLDGTAWTPAARNVPLSNVGAAFDPTLKTLFIKVSFTGGVTDDTSYLSGLRVIGYESGVAATNLDRTVTTSYPAIVREDFEPVEYNERNGVVLNGGTFTITGDAAKNVKTVEVWMKRTSDDTWTFSGNLNTANTFYSNGVNGSAYPKGQWVLRHFVITAGTVSNISFTGAGNIGQVVLYDTALTAAQVDVIYESYTGKPITRVLESSPLVTFGSSDVVTSYDYDWEIVGVD